MPKRTRQELDALETSLYQITNELRPMTIRSLFYRAVSAGIVDKTEREYKTIVRVTGKLRKNRTMPFDWLVDAGRFVRQANTWASPQSILRAVRNQYRYDYWLMQKNQVEIWVEKDAIVGVIEETTEKYSVPLYSCKGYPSLSLIDKAIRAWPTDKTICIRYFGDHDPSGTDIPRFIQDAMRYEIGFDDSIELDFQVVAVTEEQIQEHSLPTRPTKPSDSRSANFSGESVELDAFDPNVLRQLIAHSIEIEIDKEDWNMATAKEERDHQALNTAIDSIDTL